MPSSKVPNKFWSFKDTKHYKKADYNVLCNRDVYRRFIFTKSYLLEVYDSESSTVFYVIPLEFSSRRFPEGCYSGMTFDKRNFFFAEEDIIKVINEN